MHFLQSAESWGEIFYSFCRGLARGFGGERETGFPPRRTPLTFHRLGFHFSPLACSTHTLVGTLTLSALDNAVFLQILDVGAGLQLKFRSLIGSLTKGTLLYTRAR